MKSENLKNTNLGMIQVNNDSEFSEQQNNINELELFGIVDIEEYDNNKVGLISVSDIYSLSENKDSLAISNGKSNQKYFELNGIYRQRLLTKTHISESDSVYIYNYEANDLMSLPIKKLKTIAYLNIYTDVNNCPCNQDYYMIGFEVPKTSLNNLNEALVYIGKQNPFIKGEMKPIVWKKIKYNEFPITKSNLKISKNNGNTYAYKSDKYYYFINDYKVKIENSSSDYENTNRHLMIVDIKTGNLIFERNFEENESSSPSQLNFGISDPNNKYITDVKNQWTGKLFKNYPEVIFGFEDVSFGCPNIMFINSKKKDIYINCDNRH